VQIVVPFVLWKTPHIEGKLNTTVNRYSCHVLALV
jgi:hypothetical protein